MKLKRLEIENFRNIRRAKLYPSSGLNGFWGANGQGKTNLLEALYACLRGKSFRPYASRADWIPKFPDGSTRVLAEFEDERGFQAECLMFQNAQKKWDFLINGKKARPSHLRERFSIVAFSPDDHELIRGGPEIRRSFLDDVFMDICPGYTEVLERFEKALKQRNHVLRSMAAQTESEFRKWNLELDTWTRTLAEQGFELLQLRRELWPTFEEKFLKVIHELFFGHSLEIEVKYLFDIGIKQKVNLNNDLYQAIKTDFHKDLATAWTHRGPQRDDFEILINQSPTRMAASQGQARLLALALKWMHAEWVRNVRGALPLFLIDDFSSELDAGRRKQLLSLITNISGQHFVSGTERSVVDSAPNYEYTHYFVHEGFFEPEIGVNGCQRKPPLLPL